MSLRITGGCWRGRVLKVPSGKIVRPTGSRVREALFNRIGQDLSGKSFADLYAGSGAVGLEAASRGASRVCLVEHNRAVQNNICFNLGSLGNPQSVELVRADAMRVFQQWKEKKIRWDFLFIDPPFVRDYPFLEGIDEILAGTAVFQYPARQQPKFFRKPDELRTYGESDLAFFYT